MARVDASTRKTALLEALRALLDERPAGEVYVSDITAGAGLGRSAFYFYFPSKSMAIAELLREPYEHIYANAERFLLVEPSSAALRGALGQVLESWRRHARLLDAMLECRTTDPEARAIWDRWIDEFVALVQRRVETEREGGSVPPGPDAALMARALVGMNVHLLGLPVTDDAALLDALTELWHRAIYAAAG